MEEGEKTGEYGQLGEDWRTGEGKKERKGRRDGKEGGEKGRRNLVPTVISKSRRLWLQAWKLAKGVNDYNNRLIMRESAEE